MQHIFEKVSRRQQRGFTLVEMLVVAPLIVLVIAVLVGFMLGLVGDSVTANTRSQAIYDVQNALTQIERDSYLGTQFMTTYVPHSPQGKDDGVAAFNANTDGVTNADIIINQFGTTSDPTDPARSVVYYANQPQACGGQYQANQPFFVKVVYFLKTESDGSNSLYRRTIVPLNNTGSNNGDTTCAAPWQRGSCTVQNLGNPRCLAKDTKLLTNVTSFTTQYYNKANPTLYLTDPTIADSVRANVTINKSVAGKTVTQTASVVSSRTNSADPTPKPPTTPVISVLNPTDNTYNNPVLTTFQWAATGVTQYSYTYQVNGGTWSTPVVTTGTSVGVPTLYSNVPITLSVTAMNDNGSSTAQYTYTTPLWTVPTLQNNWVNYANTYAAAGYTKTSSGIVVLKGLVKLGTTTSTLPIFTLPVGCRPSEANMFLAGGVSAADRVDVIPAGLVEYETGSSGFLSLDGIAFIPLGGAPASTGIPYVWTPLVLQSNWVNFVDTNVGWATPGYTMDNLGRVFTKGLIKSGTPGNQLPIATLPVSYRAPQYMHIATTSNNTFDATGFNQTNGIEDKGTGLTAFRSIQHNYYAVNQGSWSNLTLQNGWAQYPANTLTYTSPQYTKGSDGIVKVKGLITGGTVASGTVVANLPPGYRPAEVSLQSDACNMQYCRFDVQPNGNIVTRDYVSSAWSSMDAITFMAEQ